MSKQTKDKQPEDKAAELRRSVETLRLERLDCLRQLRLGATTDVRKPARLRRRGAAELTRLRALELAGEKGEAKHG